MFYTSSSDNNHETIEWFDSLFEATCFYYECLPEVRDGETWELGSMESTPDDDDYGERDGDWASILTTS